MTRSAFREEATAFMIRSLMVVAVVGSGETREVPALGAITKGDA
jgi:hypothetical protein